MGFFKKLFTGIGFAAGFLFFGCLSVIVYASRGRHKPRHRRSSFWNTLERYLIFSWICDGVRSSRKRAETSYRHELCHSPWGSIPKDLQEPLHRYVSEAEGKLCGYCKEELCNSESGRMVVELYLGKQDGHGSRILY